MLFILLTHSKYLHEAHFWDYFTYFCKSIRHFKTFAINFCIYDKMSLYDTGLNRLSEFNTRREFLKMPNIIH